jgi:outer membrane protein assembly factor BamD
MTATSSRAKPLRIALVAGLAAVSTLVAGCAGRGGGDKDTAYVARDVETLYTEAKRRLDTGNTKIAAALFDEVERQHPYSPWARRAQLMSAFSYYVARDYNKAIQSAQRFLSIHPGNKDAPYAYYLIALSYYEQISDVQRDQKVTEQARTALREVNRRFPTTEYAADARLKLDQPRARSALSPDRDEPRARPEAGSGQICRRARRQLSGQRVVRKGI